MDAIRTIMTLTAAFMAISCSGLRKAAGSEEKVSVDCAAEIDYSGAGTADIDITAEVPERFRNPNTGIMLVPTLVSKDGTKRIPLLSCIVEGSLHNTFNGRNDIYEPDLSDSISVRKRYSRHGATGLESRNAVSFEEWMMESWKVLSMWTFMPMLMAAGCFFLPRYSRFLQRTRILLRIWNL